LFGNTHPHELIDALGCSSRRLGGAAAGAHWLRGERELLRACVRRRRQARAKCQPERSSSRSQQGSALLQVAADRPERSTEHQSTPAPLALRYAVDG